MPSSNRSRRRKRQASSHRKALRSRSLQTQRLLPRRRIGSFRIILQHVLANVTGPILTYASSLVSVAIIISSGLSFLGLGASPPIADWGLMLNTLRQAIYVAPINAVLPGVMIFAASVSFNLFSDSLRTAMDVRA